MNKTTNDDFIVKPIYECNFFREIEKLKSGEDKFVLKKEEKFSERSHETSMKQLWKK
jgi:hypothetical protein